MARSREDKLKKGLVHIFLMTQALKQLVQQINDDVKKTDPWQDAQQRAREFGEKYLLHVDEMIFHAFKAYKNLKDSFREIESLLKEIDRAIYDVFGVPYREIEEELSDMNIEKFIQLFIKYNPELYEQIMNFKIMH